MSKNKLDVKRMEKALSIILSKRYGFPVTVKRKEETKCSETEQLRQ